jgi:hypothetical protein
MFIEIDMVDGDGGERLAGGITLNFSKVSLDAEPGLTGPFLGVYKRLAVTGRKRRRFTICQK